MPGESPGETSPLFVNVGAMSVPLPFRNPRLVSGSPPVESVVPAAKSITPLLLGKPVATSVPAATRSVPVFVIGASSVCAAAEPTALMNVPALMKLLFTGRRSAEVTTAALEDVSVIVPAVLLTSAVATAPPPPSTMREPPPMFVSPALSHSAPAPSVVIRRAAEIDHAAISTTCR